MAIPWDPLFELLFQLLGDCGDSDSARAEIAQNRPVAVRFGVTKSLRKLGFKGRDLRKARVEVLDEINEATDEEVVAFAKGGSAALMAVDKAV